MFTCLTVTLRKTVIKPNFAKILRFSLKKGGSQAGVYPISTPAGSRRVPLLLTPLFLLGKRKITAQLGFPTVSRNCNWKKVKQKTISKKMRYFTNNNQILEKRKRRKLKNILTDKYLMEGELQIVTAKLQLYYDKKDVFWILLWQLAVY